MMSWLKAMRFIEFLYALSKSKKGLKKRTKNRTKKRTKSTNHCTVVVKRHWYTDKSTIGRLYVNGHFECHTLEDPVRKGPKIYGKTAIPAGTYNVIINHSPKYGRKLPRLQKVPGFKGILIHAGNTPEDTHGCILVGESKGKDVIYLSRKAFDQLFKKLLKFDKITITIKDKK